jgi:sirohydrochlorin cobaltochelatase
LGVNDDLSDAALVVLGHGTVLNEQSAAPVRQHAAELRRRRIFHGVHEAFWKQEPQIQTVLAGIAAPRIFIAPLFLSDGYFAGQVIPAALGFHYPDRLSLTTPSSTWFYCRPVGSHPGMTQVILARAAEVVKQFPFPRIPKNAETTLFIAGHGTERNKNSRGVAEEHAEWIRAQNLYAAVHANFM